MSHHLEEHGIRNSSRVYWNLSAPELVEHALAKGEGRLAENGALLAQTGHYTGRSPQDKFVVREPSSEAHVHWGTVNKPFDAERFDRLHERVRAYLETRELYVLDCFAGADPRYQLPVRVINELAWHNLFARQLFLRPPEPPADHEPKFLILAAPGFQADPARDGTRSEAFIILHFAKGIVLIGGTAYAGEMKKSVFTVLNYLLPFQGVMPMHCSANIGASGDTALFFGLSGTGKTTLSADPARRLIGDDEHGWSDTGVFNFEGGCYAKCIRLSEQHEPQIWAAIRFGAVLENVVADSRRRLDFNDDSLTENTRAAYPVEYIPNAVIPGVGGHPRNVVFLTADAFGVLPPIARLSIEQAMYYFLSGYTAKVAGTEAGLGSEPQATFSTCFAAPFLPLSPSVYAGLLGEKLRKHNARVWLVNTGWTGGPFGAGRRIHLPYTRAMVSAALAGQLEDVPVRPDPIFGLQAPSGCPGVPPEILEPRRAWADSGAVGAAYEAKARDLAARFADNFQRFTDLDAEVRQAGPRVEVKV